MERFYLEYHPDFYPFLKAIPSNLLILRLIRQKLHHSPLCIVYFE